ncbi:MAG: hypothetical protein IJT27_07085 [Clostridia bacterium]|nr:hypothetical protein [Clostridia bacterium]
MLGKLIKHSFKANASAVYNVYIAMGIVGIVMLFLMLIDWTSWGDRGITMGMVFKGIAAFALCLTALVGVILTFVAVFGEFERSMYSKEGHLTFTLPVKSSSLLLAKWISGSFWVILSYTAFCLCVFCSTLYLMRQSLAMVEENDVAYSVYEMVRMLIDELSEYGGLIKVPSMTVVFNLVTLYGFNGGIRACTFVLQVYFGITLARCRPFHKIGHKLGKVLYFFGAFFVTFTFAQIVTKLISIHLVISENMFTFTISQREVETAWSLGYGAMGITNLYVTAVLSVLLFLITALLIDRKVNVD